MTLIFILSLSKEIKNNIEYYVMIKRNEYEI